MSNQKQATRQKIMLAARDIFIHKGYNGARMQEIADAAGLNKALLHYYFRDKDHLFNSIFKEVVADIFPSVLPILNEDLPFPEKLVRFIHTYIDLLIAHPHLPAFVLHEINVNPERFTATLQSYGFEFTRINKQIQTEIIAQRLRGSRPEQLLVNLLSLCIFPFIAQPVIKSLFNMDENEMANFMDSRKSEVVNFFLQSNTAEEPGR